jgi:pimeloyl-ACP methyl ester carboxylesterase
LRRYRAGIFVYRRGVAGQQLVGLGRKSRSSHAFLVEALAEHTCHAKDRLSGHADCDRERRQEVMPESADKEATPRDLSVTGYSFRYLDEGAGMPILFVHGSQSDYRTWRPQMEAFRMSYRVLAYSRRYHWPNEPIRESVDYSMPQHVDDLEAIINALKIAPVNLVGHSYGAFVSILLGLRRPDLISRLVLAEPPVITMFVTVFPKPHDLVQLLVTRPKLAAAILKFGARAIAPATAALRRGNRDAALVIMGQAVLGRESFHHLSPERLQQARDNLIPAELLGSGFPRLDPKQLGELRLPVHLVSGARTPPLFRLLTEALHDMLPTATRAEIPHASHLMHEENAEAYNAALSDILSSPGGSERSGMVPVMIGR